MEGFTGLPRATSNFLAASPLNALGWSVVGKYNGANNIPADGYVTSVIEADSTFGSRNQLSLNRITNTGSINYFHQVIRNLDTTGYEKFVIGGLFMVTTSDASANACILCFGDQTPWTSSTGSYPFSNIFVQLQIPNNGDDGQVKTNTGSVTLTTPLVKKGKWTHFELLLEQDVDRVRLYLDGTLVYDASWTGTFASASGGFGVTFLRNVSTTANDTHKLSNLYCLGVDSVHTGPVGPSARVLEVAPPSDYAVQFSRPASYASNAAVLAQMYNATSSDYVTAGDPATDLYGGIDAVAANAAQVYGAVMKVNAMSMADGTHTIASAARSGSTDVVSAKTFPLTLGVLKPIEMDISKNPATNSLWTPAEITAAGIGFRLVQ